MNFDYYFGSQADQFSFVKIPRLLLTGSTFAPLSIAAKVLYGVLLDRMTLSMKNGWLDENNRVFIIYQIGEIQEDLGFTKKKAMDLLAELEKFGLLEKKRRGHGLPNILYVKNFMTDETGTRSIGSDTSSPEITLSRSDDSDTSESKKIVADAPRSPLFGTPGCDIITSEVPESEPLEVPKSEPLKNKTKNYTYMSYTESNHIVSPDNDAIRSDDEIAEAYLELIKENIDYDSLLQRYPYDHDLIRGIVDLMLETVLCKGPTVLIASNSYPTELVKSKFLKLDYFHIEYVISCLNSNTTKVKNIKKYLLATLFNAPSTIDGYYKAEVNHDMYRAI